MWWEVLKSTSTFMVMSEIDCNSLGMSADHETYDYSLKTFPERGEDEVILDEEWE